MALPLVAIVGRPNVGKSTLYNRLAGGRPALVDNVPGVTRDRRYGEAQFGGRRFAIVDTGGLDPDAESGVITEGIHRQAERAIAQAALVVLVIDSRAGVTPTDREVARNLRRAGRPVIVVANKVDDAAQEVFAGEAYSLGFGDVLAVSATHGRGTRELLDEILRRLGDSAPKEWDEAEGVSEGEGASGDDGDGDGADGDDGDDDDGHGARERAREKALVEANRPIRLAFVGRPNAGKSSLVNRLLGEERVLVHDKPGTTTDPVDTPFEFGGQRYVLVDTAGIRRKSRIEEVTEKISVSMALGQIERADVAALVLDAKEDGPADQDAKIGSVIQDAGTAVVILYNKSDLLTPGAEKALRDKVSDTLPFLSFAKVRFVSAQSGHGVAEALAEVRSAYGEHGKRIQTAELNRFFAEICETHPPPTVRNKSVRIFYITQAVTHPPTFLLFANRPELVHYGYRRYLANQLRQRFGFEGTPLRIITRRKKGSR
ncbi:MAG: ribosome biogenesis GTPase Der [Myxococcales bacterium]|nr:ribosome biogenesis GTPase Der [Myxococcales bacterium]